MTLSTDSTSVLLTPGFLSFSPTDLRFSVSIPELSFISHSVFFFFFLFSVFICFLLSHFDFFISYLSFFFVLFVDPQRARVSVGVKVAPTFSRELVERPHPAQEHFRHICLL